MYNPSFNLEPRKFILSVVVFMWKNEIKYHLHFDTCQFGLFQYVWKLSNDNSEAFVFLFEGIEHNMRLSQLVFFLFSIFLYFMYQSLLPNRLILYKHANNCKGEKIYFREHFSFDNELQPLL